MTEPIYRAPMRARAIDVPRDVGEVGKTMRKLINSMACRVLYLRYCAA